MKNSWSLIVATAALLLVGAGCSAQQQVSVNTPPASLDVTAETAAAIPAPAEESNAQTTEPAPETPTPAKPIAEVTTKVSAALTGSPVQFTALGIDPANSKYGLFKIKINADNVSQVNIAFKSYDAGGAIVRDTNYGWQNIVNGEQKAIVPGQTYSDKYVAGSGSVKTEASVTSVDFADGTAWSAK